MLTSVAVRSIFLSNNGFVFNVIQLNAVATIYNLRKYGESMIYPIGVCTTDPNASHYLQRYIKRKGCTQIQFWSIFFENVFRHDDVNKWKHFPRYWPFVWGTYRSPVICPHKVQWRGALMFSLICAWINSWVNNREVGDLRRYRSHYDVIVMVWHITERGPERLKMFRDVGPRWPGRVSDSLAVVSPRESL